MLQPNLSGQIFSGSNIQVYRLNGKYKKIMKKPITPQSGVMG
jgi:hypothetical protein